MKIRSRQAALAFAAIGLMSYAACTAEKSETKAKQMGSLPPPKPEVSIAETVKQSPKLMDGVFATDENLKPVYFDLNKSKLSNSAMDIVKANAAWLNSQPPFLIRVLGYADQRGSLKKNERLAAKRADAMKEAYVASGIAAERISVVTRGAEEVSCQPITEDCLAQSRRTETLMEEKHIASR